MLDAISENGKIVTVGSMVSLMALKKIGPELKKEYLSDDLTKEKLDELAERFFLCYRDESWEKKGFFDSMYFISKLNILVYVKMFAKYEKVIKKGI